MRPTCRTIAAALMLTAAAGDFGRAQDDVLATLTRVADRVIAQTSYRFIDSATGLPAEARRPAVASVRIASEYNDWAYFVGVMLGGMMELSDATSIPRWREYVVRNFDFTFDHLEYFREQWDTLGVRKGSFYRIFRMNMLDDCGAMGAALADAYHLRPDERYWRMLQKIAAYVSTGQLRLNDGTLARPDPHPLTLWADDLYMSVPFLVRMGELTGDKRFVDDACRQVRGFMMRLRDPRTGLLKHAWFADTQTASVAAWGRANGWAVMAQVELLRRLPAAHPQRDTLIRMLADHLQALCAWQDSSGLWHQVLDHPDSYLETSCSAMFCYGLATAVRNGWIDPTFADHARKAWNGVAKNVRPDGQIEGICRGTEVGQDLRFYFDRPAPLNDTRGIGAVLFAGAAILRLSNERR